MKELTKKIDLFQNNKKKIENKKVYEFLELVCEKLNIDWLRVRTLCDGYLFYFKHENCLRLTYDCDVAHYNYETLDRRYLKWYMVSEILHHVENTVKMRLEDSSKNLEAFEKMLQIMEVTK